MSGTNRPPGGRSRGGDPLRLGGVALLALAFACLLVPSRGVLWTAAAPAAAIAALLCSWRRVRPQADPCSGMLLCAMALVCLVCQRWSDLSVTRGAWLLGGLSLAAAVCAGAVPRRTVGWLGFGVAVASVLSACAGELIGSGTGEWAFAELWTVADAGVLVPAYWGLPASAVGATALPLIPWLARDPDRPWLRPWALALGWVLLVGLAYLRQPIALVAVVLGVLAVMVARRAWKRLALVLASVALASVVAGLALPAASRTGLRKEALVRGGAWLETRAHLTGGVPRASQRTASLPIRECLGLAGFGGHYEPPATARPSALCGIERPATALCDPLQWAAEAGAALAGVVLAFLLVRAFLMGFRHYPYVFGALVAMGACSLVGGVCVSPAVGWVALAVVALAAQPPDPDGPPRNGVDPRWVRAAAWIPTGLALAAVVVAGLASLAPRQASSAESTRPAKLWHEAEASGDDETWRRAGQAFTLRWEALDHSAHADVIRVSEERDLYRRFCLANAARLSETDPAASEAYLSLADQLR